MSSELHLGTILKERMERDAIHIAIASVVASELLHPGEFINFISPDDIDNVKADSDGIGIVDPYLRTPVNKGDIFWMHLLPGTITSLKHQWSHPAFDALAAKIKADHERKIANETFIFEESRRWIEDWASGIGIEYDEALSAARRYVRNGDYWSEGARFDGEYVPDEFWDHFEVVTESQVSSNDRGSFFSCSC